MKLCKLRGNLCVGGMCLNDVDVFMDEELIGAPANWTGQIQVDHSLQHSLDLQRQYLLTLDDDSMSCVKLISFRPGPEVTTVLADFVVCNRQ